MSSTANEPLENDTKTDSKTPVYRREKHGFGIWGGPRIVANFRCDETLWKRFKRWSRHKYGSICKPLESVLVALMEAHTTSQDGRYTDGNTLEEKPVPVLHVENMHIHRNLSRERRDLKPSDSVIWDLDEMKVIDEVVDILVRDFKPGVWPTKGYIVSLIIPRAPHFDGSHRVLMAEEVVRLVRERRRRDERGR